MKMLWLLPLAGLAMWLVGKFIAGLSSIDPGDSDMRGAIAPNDEPEHHG